MFFLGNYPINKNCDWTVSVPAGQKVKIVFTKFETESRYDPVKVYDGSSKRSTKIKTISGTTIPAEITTTGNKLHVTFKSDQSITSGGFKAIVSGVNW